MFVRKFGRQAAEFFQGVINGRERQFFGFNFAAVGVAAYLETGLLNQLAQFDNAVELRQVLTLQQGFLDTGDFFDSSIGRGAQLLAVRFAGLSGQGDTRHRASVIGNSGQLLFNQYQVFGRDQLLV